MSKLGIMLAFASGAAIGSISAAVLVNAKKDKEYNEMVDYVQNLLQDKMGLTIDELANVDEICKDEFNSLDNPDAFEGAVVEEEDSKSRTSIVVMEEENPTKYHRIIRQEGADDEDRWEHKSIFDENGDDPESEDEDLADVREEGRVVITEREFNDPDFTIHSKVWCGWYPEDDIVVGENKKDILGTSADLFPDIDLYDIFAEENDSSYVYIRDYDSQISYCILQEVGGYVN